MNVIISEVCLSHCITHAYKQAMVGIKHMKEPNSKMLSYSCQSCGGSGFLSSNLIQFITQVGTWYLGTWYLSAPLVKIRQHFQKLLGRGDCATQFYEPCILWKSGNEISNWIL